MPSSFDSNLGTYVRKAQLLQIINAWQGQANSGVPLSLTTVSSDTSPAATFRNLGNGGALKVMSKAGATLFLVDDSGTTISLSAGSLGAPGLTLGGDADSGLYKPDVDRFGWSFAGVKLMDWRTGNLEFLDKITSTIGTIATSKPAFSSTATWDGVGITFVHDFRNITDSNSAAGSLLAQWQVGGVDKFSVTKAGLLTAVTIAGAMTPTSLTLVQSAGATPTAEGRIEWDTDDDTIKMGDGATTKEFGFIATTAPGSIDSGDAASAGTSKEVAHVDHQHALGVTVVTTDTAQAVTGAKTFDGASNVSVLIAETVLVADAADITFSSIPATYSHLEVVITGRSMSAVSMDNIVITLNGDTGANYDTNGYYCIGDTAMTPYESLARTSLNCGWLPGTLPIAGMTGTMRLLISNYKRTTFWKTAVSQSMAFSDTADVSTKSDFGHQWRSTSAITTIKLWAGGGDLKAGTVASLYGKPD